MRTRRGAASRHQERVLIVGGGLVGCVLGMYLVRRGFAVRIYERNRDCRTVAASRRPSLSLSLCTRGIRSLERIGAMDRVRPFLAPAFGRMLHARDGAAIYQPYSEFGDAIHCVSRRDLHLALLGAAEERGVEILFGHQCIDLDPTTGEIAIQTHAGTRVRDRARAVFAADGSSSSVRRRLARAGWWQETQVSSGDGYKQFRISSASASAMGLRADALHAWPALHSIAGGFPQPDGSFSGTLHMPLSGPVSFDTLLDGSAAAVLLDASYPQLLRAVPDLVEHLARQRPNLLATVTCRPWSAAGGVLLLGDAAHAMLPYYGQGANAGFEDCEILDEAIERHGPDWARVFSEFEDIRKPDVDAMADLCAEHLGVLRDLVTQAGFQAQMRFEQQLHRLFADVFTPLYSMIAFSSMSYAEARQRDRLQQQVIGELLRDPDIRRQMADAVWPATLRQHIRSRLFAAVPARRSGGTGIRRRRGVVSYPGVPR